MQDLSAHMFLYPLLDPASRMIAGEVRQGFAFSEDDDRGEATHPVVSGKFHVLAFIHFQFCKLNSPLERFDGLVEVRRQGMAGAAPVGPEIHQHRKLMRALDHLFIKLVQVNIKDVVCVGQGIFRMKWVAAQDFSKITRYFEWQSKIATIDAPIQYLHTSSKWGNKSHDFAGTE